MRIAVNTRLLLKGRLEGIGWYSYQLLSRLVNRHPEHQFFFFFDRPYDPSFVFADNVTPVVAYPQARHPVLFYLWTEWTIPFLLRKYKADVFFSPEGMGSLRSKVPQVITIHDLAFEHFPGHLIKSHLKWLRFYTPRFAQKACRVLTVSQFSKQDLIERYQVPAHKIDITYNSADDAYQPVSEEEREAVKAKYTEGNEYFLFAGSLNPRKNIIRLLEAFVKFKKHHRCNMKLVMVGGMGWNYDDLLRYRAHMPFKQEVKWVGYMDKAELSRITAAAWACVYPSLFEGFGIPILEALACGVPGIVGNNSSMPEVGGEAVLLADAEDVDDIAHKMGMMYKDERLRQQLAAAAPAQVEKFSWDKSAEVLYEALVACADINQKD